MSFVVHTEGNKYEFGDTATYRVKPGGVLETVDDGETHLWSTQYWVKVEAAPGHKEGESYD
ncbi:hypothetical protein E3G52_000346 [Mycobacteroides abscessus]|uniref:hypothetical protein n=1 Tax=Mycobacteroides abscessus TaxID=36809 RepID=UPI001878D5D7|nr:hypothetical protein [Mycobacteroides abscessus]MBE5453482.1 hypothetical protein [Mycobacteroides abscessus]